MCISVITRRWHHSPVTCRGYEVEAGVDTGVWYGLLTSDAHFFVEVLLKLIVHIVQDWLPAKQNRNTTTHSYQ